MELRRLFYFTVLAKHMHFGRAAEEIRIAQPGLSQQIKVLEREMNAKLISRDKQEISLTPAGEVLKRDASALLQQVENLEQRVAATAMGRTGVLRVAYTRSAADTSVTDLVRKYRFKYPQMDVSTVTGWTSWNLELLCNNKIDIAFVRGPVSNDGIETLTVDSEELVVALPSGHSLAGQQELDIADIRDEPVVLWPRHQGAAFFDSLVSQVWPNSAPNVAHEEPESEQILAAVASGVGSSVLDARRARKLSQSEAVVVLPFSGPSPPSVDIAIAWRADDKSSATQHFLRWCRQTIANAGE
jgi:DNA-binding transcriptional LysR family regulator